MLPSAVAALAGLVQGITEFTFWGYQQQEKLQIAQVPFETSMWHRSAFATLSSGRLNGLSGLGRSASGSRH
jgi:hypothetical protein